MPYIPEERRKYLNDSIDHVIDELYNEVWNDGSVNYVIYKLMLAWWDQSPGYHRIKDVQGTLDCVSKEFYRRVAVPYEEKKIKKNGDIEITELSKIPK